MRKVKGKQRILAVMLCVGLALQGLPLESFAAEMDSVTEIAEDLVEREVESSEIESWIEVDTEVQEMEGLTETGEYGNYSETKTAFETEKSNGEDKIPVDEKLETDAETEDKNEETTSEDVVLQEGEVLSGQCGDNLTWKIENGTLIISGTGDMWDYEYKWGTVGTITTAPWGEYKDELKGLIIDESVTSIGNEAFHGCDGFGGKLIIPNSVTSIGIDAFYWCNGFDEKLELPNSVIYIKDGAFGRCTCFKGEVVIPNSVISIGRHAFYGCDNLTDIYITESLTEIGDFAFQTDKSGSKENLNITFHCPKKSYVYNWALQNGFKVVEWDEITIGGDTPIPPSDDTITGECGDDLTWTLKDTKENYTLIISGTGDMYDYALENNTSTAPWIKHIKSKTVALNIEEGVTSIGKYAFYDCEKLNGDLILPNSLISIGDNAFYNCTGITDIYIYDTLTKIGGNPFRYFNALIGTFKNMELTLHCIKDSYAYKWAEDNGFTVEEWDGITIDIRKSDITINGRGYAYARFLLKDNKGQVQKNTTISYSFGGRSYTATSDSAGYVQIRSELISDNKETKKQIKTTEIILDPNGKKEKLNNRVVMVVKVTPFTYTQTWKVGVSSSIEAGLKPGADVKGGAAEAGASFGKALITGSGKGTVALEIEHSGSKQNIKLEQNFNSRGGLKASAGPEVKAKALGKDINIKPLSISGSGSVGMGQGIGLKIDNYNPGSFNDNLKIGKFAIAMIGSQTGNNMLIRLVDTMG